MVVTPAALEYYQEKFRQLAFEFAECWFLCCKAEDACRAKHLFRIRHKMMVQNGGAFVSWSEVLIAAADDSKYWTKEVRRPAMMYLARQKKGGVPTAAYEEDPTGITAKVRSQPQVGGHEPPPVSDPTSLKRRKKTRAEKKRKAVSGADNGAHPKSQNGKCITSRECVEICFTFAKNGRNACPEPCRNKRAHLCQLCLGMHRSEECNSQNS